VLIGLGEARDLRFSLCRFVVSRFRRSGRGSRFERSLVKSVLDIFVAIGMDSYENDFEAALLDDTSVYYSRKAALWINQDSCPDYILKVKTKPANSFPLDVIGADSKAPRAPLVNPASTSLRQNSGKGALERLHLFATL